jgi:hypothetical protein
MKANAPEKIYLQVCGDCNVNDCDNCKFEDLEDNVTWCKDKIFKNDVEYVRKDAFIENACKWLKNHYRDYMHNPTGKRLEAFFGGDMCNDFEDYMKVE